MRTLLIVSLVFGGVLVATWYAAGPSPILGHAIYADLAVIIVTVAGVMRQRLKRLIITSALIGTLMLAAGFYETFAGHIGPLPPIIGFHLLGLMVVLGILTVSAFLEESQNRLLALLFAGLLVAGYIALAPFNRMWLYLLIHAPFIYVPFQAFLLLLASVLLRPRPGKALNAH